MTTSSVLTNSFNWSSDSVGITAQEIQPLTSDQISALSNITINSTTGSSYYYTGAGISSGNTFTISSTGAVSGTISSGPTITLTGSAGYEYKMPIEFVDTLPDISRIQKMCEQYPGLKIAFEKFKTTYQLVKDHYDTPEDQRPLP